jgi:hypothetical protein
VWQGDAISGRKSIVNEQQIIHPTATTFKPWSRTVIDVYEVGLVGDETFSILRLNAKPVQSTSAITCFVNGLALCPGIDFDLGDTVVIEGSVVYTIALKNAPLVAGDRAWVTYGCYGR